MKKSRKAPDAARDPAGRSMKERVQERTRELEALNRELHEEISARVRAEEILLREKAYLEALANNNYTGLIVIDRAGRHTYANNSFSARTGYSGCDL
jgi:PAS domain-containing protein